MFTGIIEEMGVVKTLTKSGQGCALTVLAKRVLEGLSSGDSIAVSGVCMTVSGFESDEFRADVSPETVKVTTLGALRTGDPLNLERSMRLSDRLSGHLVTGHVDGRGTVRERIQEANGLHLLIEAPQEVLRYCVVKGSITVDGVSLTINELAADTFRATIIPHTARLTTLGLKRTGELVNLESDLLGKYIDRLLQDRTETPRPEIKIDRDYLARRGLL
jgi:riboflavin synthase